MKKVELFECIRQDYFNDKKSIRQIAKKFSIHRREVRQAIKCAIPPERKKTNRTCKVLTPELKQLINIWLEEDQKAPRKQRHTGKRAFERLAEEYGFNGAEVTVRSYVYQRRKELGARIKVFVPQIHLPGKEAEVDWYNAEVDFPTGREEVFLFLMRACFSGKEFHRAFQHETQQAFEEGHTTAFNYFGGVFEFIRYDNLTSAVKKILQGRKRIQTERFIAMRSHYLFQPIFCLPGLEGAHEKGGVECGVGRFRRAHLVPVPKVSGMEELNQLLLAACQKDDQRIIIGKNATIAEHWKLEESKLLALPKEEFSTADVTTVKVNNKGLVTIRGNYYSVPVDHVGLDVEAHLKSEKIIIMKRGNIIAEHRRSYGKHESIVELKHYLSSLKHKPGALKGSVALQQARENGQWPAVFENYWQLLITKYGPDDANKQLVDLLYWAQDFESEKIESLLAKAMELGCYRLEAIQTLMRQQSPSPTVEPLNKDALGELVRYEKPVTGIDIYNSLLTKGVLS